MLTSLIPLLRFRATARRLGTPLVLATLAIGLPAAQVPDIVWATNAHEYAVTAVAFAGNSASLASASLDGTAQVWSATNATRLRLIVADCTMEAVAFASNGTLLATGDSCGRTTLWRVGDGSKVWHLIDDQRMINALAFSPSDEFVAAGLTLEGLNLIRTDFTDGYYLDCQYGDVRGVAFSPDNSLLASAATDKKARLWLMPAGTFSRSLHHSNKVNSVDFSPDGTLLATACADGMARLWNVSAGTVARVINGGGTTARFSADGRLLLTVNEAGAIQVWRVADGALLQTYPDTAAWALAVAPNGKYFAYGTASGVVVLARMPLVVHPPALTNQQFRLEWQGGAGLYQLQQTTNLTSAVWQDVGAATTNLAASLPTTNPATFYRIQSLSTVPLLP